MVSVDILHKWCSSGNLTYPVLWTWYLSGALMPLFGKGNWIIWTNPPQCYFVHRRSHMTWRGIKLGLLWWKLGNWLPVLWHGQHRVKHCACWKFELGHPAGRVIDYVHITQTVDNGWRNISHPDTRALSYPFKMIEVRIQWWAFVNTIMKTQIIYDQKISW
jgi:hypothetical protein